jgi:hypothetical protein
MPRRLANLSRSRTLCDLAKNAPTRPAIIYKIGGWADIESLRCASRAYNGGLPRELAEGQLPMPEN